MPKPPLGVITSGLPEFDEHGDAYMMRFQNIDGQPIEAVVSVETALALAQLAQALRVRSEAKLSPPGYEFLAAMPVERTRVTLDLHQMFAVMTLYGKTDAPFPYSLTANDALRLAHKLVAAAEKLDAAPKTTTKQ